MYQGKFLAENRAAKAEQPKKAAAVPTADEIMDEELAVQEQNVPETPAPETEEAPKSTKKENHPPGGSLFLYSKKYKRISSSPPGNRGLHYSV